MKNSRHTQCNKKYSQMHISLTHSFSGLCVHAWWRTLLYPFHFFFIFASSFRKKKCSLLKFVFFFCYKRWNFLHWNHFFAGFFSSASSTKKNFCFLSLFCLSWGWWEGRKRKRNLEGNAWKTMSCKKSKSIASE